ncbi:MAG TPA: SGNH/GDSL hydrolase family protein [Bacteroidales bacterium]|nr:SGNH/GDSL hydrolase family protein [Bacteroidales bacterium]
MDLLKNRAAAIVLLLIVHLSAFSQDTTYYGFRCHNFRFEDYDARIVFPVRPEPEMHWIWRARFWGHEPQTEIALLRKGFHLVFIDAPDLCGNREAVQLWNRFYDFLVRTYGLNNKTVLEGFSRGGLYIYNWGSENPEKVACIYADAPVCDINSWPGGKGKGVGSPSDWQLHLKAYGLTEENAGEFRGMPVYNCTRLAEAKVPVLHVCGAADDIVPVEENTYILEKAYRAAGGSINIIMKEGVGHHPHSLKDPAPIVNFILTNTNPSLHDEPDPYESRMSVVFRDDAGNCRLKFENEKIGTVAFLGGSITYNPGWRDMVINYLKERFPQTEFNFISAGIPSLGSVPHSMRFSADVLAKGIPDLLFVEAAVNDATNGTTPEQQVRGMEGILCQALKANPFMDIIMLHFADQDKMADYNNGKVPEVIQQHEKVAAYYSIPSINLAKEVNDRVINGEFSWRDDFKNLHPSPFGQKLYFRTIEHFFKVSWQGEGKKSLVAHNLPERKLDYFSYANGHYVSIFKAGKLKGWKVVKEWKPEDGAGGRSGFMNDDVLEATDPGASLTFRFKGQAVGLFVTSGPDAGIIEYSLDGAKFKTTDQFTQWSSSLHLPWLIMLVDNTYYGRHILVLRMSAEKNSSSKGTACRIHQFVVN